jgi:hypothetical protein
MTIKIMSRESREVRFTFEHDGNDRRIGLGRAVLAALQAGTDLTNADLAGAVLARANLTNAVLTSADLRGSVLTRADLTGSVLAGADLRGSNLTGADLTGSVLAGADLTGARLADADLTRAVLSDAVLSDAVLADAVLADAVLARAVLTSADLRGSVLTRAVLADADLADIRDDVWAVLSASPAEAQAVLDALHAGTVDGSCYDGPCACLVGTIAHARQCRSDEIPGLERNACRPAERWFLAIRPGDTPATHEPTRLAAAWVADWIAGRALGRG